ncbi:MAG TPA: sugar phosphate isomerase/epimerase [Candidatus Hydrogenedentes bacterium]|nr:sugar phosphate isomerase/epimerase [Candidatus Hydrogenedentota bacterium]
MITDHEVTRRRFLGNAALAGAAAAVLPVARGRAEQQASPAAGWRIGFFTRPWDQYDYRAALDAIVEAGSRHAGLMTTNSPSHLVISVQTTPDEAHAVADECRQRSLTIPSVYGGHFPVEQSLEAGIDGLKTLIDHCATVGAEDLMLGGVGDPAIQGPYYEAVAACCDYAAEKGVGISVKPHGGLNATGPQCRAIIEGVGCKNFRLWYDPGNIFYYSDGQLDPVDDAATVDGLVVGMSVKDFRLPKDVMVTPGTGQVDFVKVLSRLRQGGFSTGALLVECLAPGELPHLLEEARKARVFLEEIVARLTLPGKVD